MKKVLLIMSIIMIFTLLGCAKEEKTEDNNAGKAFVANPWVQSTNEEIEANLGKCFIVPEGTTDVVFRYSASMGMAEMQFVYNDIKWNARMQTASEFSDISGMYYTWDSKREVELSDENGNTVKGEINLADSESGQVLLELLYYKEKNIMLSLSAVVGERTDEPFVPGVFFK